MDKVLVRYAEIGLKGKNRSDFENQLIENIKASLSLKSSQVKKGHKQIILSIDKGFDRLGQVFGIAWFAKIQTSPSNLKDILISSLSVAKKHIKSSHTFAIRASRSDKSLSFTSMDLERKVGDKVRVASKAKVNLKNPDKVIYLSAGKTVTFIFSKKIKGSGGLPVGSSGKVLSLLSGGFDSIAASYLLSKRGASVDFLHFHVFPQVKSVLESKIKVITDKLSESLLSKHLYLASYTPFQMQVLDLPNRHQKHELVVFRRLMVKVAQSLAQKHGYKALVLGDSLGQVASQTMDNIIAVDNAVDIPIFRPLIGLDKLEIINLVKKIGLEKQATMKYKDCCSIISQSPATRANLEKVHQLESILNIDKITDQICKQITVSKL